MVWKTEDVVRALRELCKVERKRCRETESFGEGIIFHARADALEDAARAFEMEEVAKP